MDRTSQRRLLRNGLVPTPPRLKVEPFPWRGGIDYNQLKDAPETFRWWLACLGFVKVLCTANPLRDAEASIVTDILRDWLDHNPQVNPALTRAWDNHAVAYRTETIVDVAERLTDSTWLEPHLREHLEFLSDETNFAGNWNHGVDQAKALLRVGRYLNDEAATVVGMGRLEASILSTVDDEGVTIEQAVHYHKYNYDQIQQVVQLLDNSERGQEIAARLHARLSKMPVFLAHATRPDGTWFEIGDTPFESAVSIPGTVAEFAATAGLAGPKPEDLHRHYINGYAFGRSGWGESRPFAQESAYALRYGQPRQIHGHFDHLSIAFVSNGIEMIKDGGFHGYTDDDAREWLRSPDAHSTLILRALHKRGGRVPSELIYSNFDNDFHSYTLLAKPATGTLMRRSVSFDFDPDVVVVWDRVEAAESTEVEQRWLLPQEARLTMDGRTVLGDLPIPFRVTSLMPTISSSAINAQESRAPLRATKTLFEMTPTAMISYTNSGTETEFLTVFQFGSAANGPPLQLHNLKLDSSSPLRVIKGASAFGDVLLDPERGVVRVN